MTKVDFGIYHRTTPEQSRRLQKYVEKVFAKLLRPLYPHRAALRIVDAGCGLGFLTSVAANCFPKATVTGVDLFRQGSMSELSVEKAIENMKSLALDARTSFVKHDLTKPLRSDVPYDLVVSNLVFHNMEKRRFAAYANVLDVLKPGAYFVIGDLFPHEKADMDFFARCSTLVDQLADAGFGRGDYKVKLLEKRS